METVQLADSPQRISKHHDQKMSTDPLIVDCECQIFEQGSCLNQFSIDTITKYRRDILNLTRQQLDLVLLGKIGSALDMSSHTHAKRKAVTERRNTRSLYKLHGKHICLWTFRYVHRISQAKLTALIKWYKQHGLKPRVHKSAKMQNCDTEGGGVHKGGLKRYHNSERSE